MRLLTELKSAKDCTYDNGYYHKMQGFVYGLIKGGLYSGLHEKAGYKFFSFSNIFPIADIREGDMRRFLISSPDKVFLNSIKEKLDEMKICGKPANMGEMQFLIRNVSLVDSRVSDNSTIITATPIILRIPKENYSKYGIVSEKDYPYIYWRPGHPFEPFIKQLEDNLLKKYNEFHKGVAEKFPLFQQFIFKKSVSIHFIKEGQGITMIGSIWEFSFSRLDKKSRDILQFGLDTGFGELNSSGFGFMNIKTDRKVNKYAR